MGSFLGEGRRAEGQIRQRLQAGPDVMMRIATFDRNMAYP